MYSVHRVSLLLEAIRYKLINKRGHHDGRTGRNTHLAPASVWVQFELQVDPLFDPPFGIFFVFLTYTFSTRDTVSTATRPSWGIP